jgi:hypothetical protein
MLDIGSRLELFVDETLIERMDGAGSIRVEIADMYSLRFSGT